MKFETSEERFSRYRSEWIMARLDFDIEERRLREAMDDAFLTDDEFYEKRGLIRAHQLSKGGDHT
jgi:hypothetical protein